MRKKSGIDNFQFVSKAKFDNIGSNSNIYLFLILNDDISDFHHQFFFKAFFLVELI